MRSIKSKKSSATHPNCLTDSEMMAEDFYVSLRCKNPIAVGIMMPYTPHAKSRH
jgi:hypothetical protein